VERQQKSVIEDRQLVDSWFVNGMCVRDRMRRQTGRKEETEGRRMRMK
jgi:hypothetical protein